jgi:hypothetical protein
MADPGATSGAIVNNLGSIITAVAALGTASMGLVDASKWFGGGPSNFGFGFIRTALTPFLPPDPGVGAFNRTVLLQTLRANWINGVAKSDQKAKAKSLIHLGISKGNAASLAEAAGVDSASLISLANKTATGAPVTPEEINVLGQFDAVLSAVLDSAYERADQRYRNACKGLATLVATVLALIAAVVIEGNNSTAWSVGLIVGLSATPLAPVAKDLVSSLQAAAGAIQSTRGPAGRR